MGACPPNEAAAAAAGGDLLTRASQVDAARLAHLENLRMEAAAANQRPSLMLVKRRWLKEFITELEAVKARPAFKLQQCLGAGRDPEEPLQVPKQDWDAGMVELPKHVAARIRKMTDMTTSVITLSSAANDDYTQAHVDSALQRLKAAVAAREQGQSEGDAQPQQLEDAQAYLLEWFMDKERAVIIIQRAFRAFRAHCQVHGWPSERDPLIMHRRHQAKARYLEGIARHGGKAALDARAAVTKLRSLAMVAAEAVATKFEHEAQLRSKAGIMRAPMSGASAEYQLQDRQYRIMMLGREFVEEEERQQRLAEEQRKRKEEQQLQEEKRREERQARERRREEDRLSRLQADAAVQSTTFLDRARRGMLGMSMDGSSQQRTPPDSPFMRGRTTRLQREAEQEEAERLAAFERAGMASGEELLRQAVLGPGAASILEAIAKAGSLLDVESIVKEEVQRLATQRILQQQQTERHAEQQQQVGELSRAEHAQDLDAATAVGPFGQDLSVSAAALDGGLPGDGAAPGTLFIPVPSFSNWRPPGELQLASPHHAPNGPQLISVFDRHSIEDDEEEGFAGPDLGVAPRTKSESHIQYQRPYLAKGDVSPPSPASGTLSSHATPPGGPSPMRSRRIGSTPPSPEASPSRISAAGAASRQRASHASGPGDGIASDKPGPTTAPNGRPCTAGAALAPRRSPRQSGGGSLYGLLHSPQGTHSTSGLRPWAPHAPPQTGGSGAVSPRPRTAGTPSYPLRARSQPLQLDTANTARPAVPLVPLHLERAVTSNAWWDAPTAAAQPNHVHAAPSSSRGPSTGGRPSASTSPAQGEAQGSTVTSAASAAAAAAAAAWGPSPAAGKSAAASPRLHSDPLVPSIHTDLPATPATPDASRTCITPSAIARAYESCRTSPPPFSLLHSPRRKSEGGLLAARGSAPHPCQPGTTSGPASGPVGSAAAAVPADEGQLHQAQEFAGSFPLVARASRDAHGALGASHLQPHPSPHPSAIAGFSPGLALTGPSSTSTLQNTISNAGLRGRASSCSLPCSPTAVVAAAAAAAAVSGRPPLPFVATHMAHPSPLASATASILNSPSSPVSPSPPASPLSAMHDPSAAATRGPRTTSACYASHRTSPMCASPKSPSGAFAGGTSPASPTTSGIATGAAGGGAAKRVAFDCSQTSAASDGRLVRFALRHSKTADDVAALRHPHGTGAAAGKQRIEKASSPAPALSAMDEGLWKDFVERVALK